MQRHNSDSQVIKTTYGKSPAEMLELLECEGFFVSEHVREIIHLVKVSEESRLQSPKSFWFEVDNTYGLISSNKKASFHEISTGVSRFSGRKMDIYEAINLRISFRGLNGVRNYIFMDPIVDDFLGKSYILTMIDANGDRWLDVQVISEETVFDTGSVWIYAKARK